MAAGPPRARPRRRLLGLPPFEAGWAPRPPPSSSPVSCSTPNASTAMPSTVPPSTISARRRLEKKPSPSGLAPLPSRPARAALLVGRAASARAGRGRARWAAGRPRSSRRAPGRHGGRDHGRGLLRHVLVVLGEALVEFLGRRKVAGTGRLDRRGVLVGRRLVLAPQPRARPRGQLRQFPAPRRDPRRRAARPARRARPPGSRRHRWQRPLRRPPRDRPRPLARARRRARRTPRHRRMDHGVLGDRRLLVGAVGALRGGGRGLLDTGAATGCSRGCGRGGRGAGATAGAAPAAACAAAVCAPPGTGTGGLPPWAPV